MVETLLDNFGEGATLGSNRDVNPDLIASHLNNALEKMLEEISYRNGSADLGDFDTVELREFGEDFNSIEQISKLIFD